MKAFKSEEQKVTAQHIHNYIFTTGEEDIDLEIEIVPPVIGPAMIELKVENVEIYSEGEEESVWVGDFFVFASEEWKQEVYQKLIEHLKL